MIKKLHPNKTLVIHLVSIIVILGLTAYHITDNTVIKIVGDEYGYWAAGSYFAGLNWAELTSINSYYGYGYGLILSLLLRLPFSAVTLYRLAIMLNGIFLCIIYITVFLTAKELIDSTKIYLYPITICSISFFVTLLTANLYYTQYTMSEVLLALLYWAIVYLAIRLYKQVTFPLCIYFILLNLFLFFVHMRTVGIVIISFLFLLLCFWKQHVSFGYRICLFLLTLIFFGIAFKVKDRYQDIYWAYAASKNASVNDISNQALTIKFLLSAEGITNFMCLFIGYLYYSFSTTYLLAIPACLFFFKYSILFFKCLFAGYKKFLNETDCLLLFCFLDWLATTAVAAIFMAGSINVRGDVTLYGRYFEFTLGPIILITICKIIKYAQKKNLSIPIFIISVAVYTIISKSINRIQNYNADKSHFFCNTSALYYWLKRLDFSPKSLLVISLVILGLFSLWWLLIFCTGAKDFVITILSILLSGIIIYQANFTYENGCLSWSVDQLSSQLELAEYINSKEINNQIYYYWKDDVLSADILQFILKENQIHTIYDIADFIENHPSDYLLAPVGMPADLLTTYQFTQIYDTPTISLWKYGGAIDE